jgi:hypothetical protein
MTNKKILLGMLAIGLVFGLALIGCDGDNPIGGDDNPFEGDWKGNFTPKEDGEDGEEIEATISFTDTTWILLAGDITLNGTYTQSSTYTASLIKQGVTIGTAIVNPVGLTSTLTLTILGSDHPGSGSFESDKSNIPSDSFDGTWFGTYTPSGSSEISNATITFTDTTWKLAPSAIAQNGTYTSSIQYTATLKVQGLTIGSAVISPLDQNLTVTILLGTSSGKGTFTRNAP